MSNERMEKLSEVTLESVTNPEKKHKPFVMPSLLAAPFFHLGSAISELESAGINVFHYDVMDGHFVPNLSGSPHIIEDLQPHISSTFDVHLMVDNPSRVIPWFHLPSVRSISIHVEASSQVEQDFDTIRSQEANVGIVINPSTPNESLDPYLEQVDQVLVMTVYPGLGGQPLIKDTLKKIEYFARRRDELRLNYAIQVDGGVKEDTLLWVLEAGANEIVCGSAIFGKENPVEAYQQLNRLLEHPE